MKKAFGALEKTDPQLIDILSRLESASLDGLEDPFNTFWICFRLLQSIEDIRAMPLLQKARTLLLERAAKIPDDTSRHSFLNNIPEHRLILGTTANPSTPVNT